MGSLSFYVPSTNQLFISVHHPGGSVNVYTHELGHAVDYQWTGTSTISRDPDWVKLHTDKILNNPNIDSYFRGGPTGTDPVSGRAELFAEGFAIFNEYGRGALVGWVKDEATADEMIRIWKKYGVFK
jgi:hypothetical protein